MTISETALPPITTAEEAVAYIHSNVWTRHAPGLDRIRTLCSLLGDPQKSLRFVHVAGTNGKGSTCAMTASILRAAGYRVGLFTSPYMIRFNERMQIDGEQIPDAELAGITSYVRPFADGMEDVPTEFELITAIGLVYFARHACDVVVFEVGMGGRMDSTNVLEAGEVAVSVITGIAMDHTAFLGDTPEKIAAEKAGIIKPGVPVVFGGAHPPVGAVGGSTIVDPVSCGRVIKARADELGAPYIPVGPSVLKNIRSDLSGSDFDWGNLKGLHIPLPGLYQPCNAATALTVVKLLRKQGMRIPAKAVRTGLASVYWPGRFEVLSRDPVIVSDGGHNPEGIDAAAATAAACFGGQKIAVLTGVMADKDYAHMAARIASVACRVFTVTPHNSRALSGRELAELYASLGVTASDYPTVAEALTAAVTLCRAQGIPLLCLGSLYMYSELREAMGL
ncbi:MAG: bifunctional folylpolyglutamate synthase/dihydrofolate synthase [Clostridia bacterium]|nr:bifunctional folylpolyglutamate synthase/dihydrofolate synthase [Clostridia bacterium]